MSGCGTAELMLVCPNLDKVIEHEWVWYCRTSVCRATRRKDTPRQGTTIERSPIVDPVSELTQPTHLAVVVLGGRTDERTHGRTDERTNGRTDGRTDDDAVWESLFTLIHLQNSMKKHKDFHQGQKSWFTSGPCGERITPLPPGNCVGGRGRRKNDFF